MAGVRGHQGLARPLCRVAARRVPGDQCDVGDGRCTPPGGAALNAAAGGRDLFARTSPPRSRARALRPTTRASSQTSAVKAGLQVPWKPGFSGFRYVAGPLVTGTLEPPTLAPRTGRSSSTREFTRRSPWIVGSLIPQRHGLVGLPWVGSQHSPPAFRTEVAPAERSTPHLNRDSRRFNHESAGFNLGFSSWNRGRPAWDRLLRAWNLLLPWRTDLAPMALSPRSRRPRGAPEVSPGGAPGPEAPG